MAIRFNCLSCKQPIEVDDEWGGESVACPYCKKVVTAPSSSTWPGQDIPEASPVQPGFAPPPPPHGRAAPAVSADVPSPFTRWSLILALTYVVLLAVAWGSMMVPMIADVARAMQKLGPNPSSEEMQEAQREVMEDYLSRGGPQPSPLGRAAAVLGAICGMAGMALGIGAMLRHEPRRLWAVPACVLCVTALCCPMPVVLSHPATAPPPPTETAPAADEASPPDENGDAPDDQTDAACPRFPPTHHAQDRPAWFVSRSRQTYHA